MDINKVNRNSVSLLDFIQSKKYPSWTPVHRIVENAETAPFKQYFATWRDIGMQHTRLIRAAKDIDSDSGMEDEFDPNEIRALKKSGGRALGFMPDHGEGDIEIWRIDNNSPVAVKPNGVLLGSKAYVLKYHYKHGGEEGYVLYFWQVSTVANAHFHTHLSIVNVKMPLSNYREPMHRTKIRPNRQCTPPNWIVN